MPNKVIEEFLRKQTMLLMQKHFLIGKADADKILANFTHAEVKIFADSIPTFAEYIDYLIWGASENVLVAHDPLSRIDIKELRMKPYIPNNAPGPIYVYPVVFSAEFKELFINKSPSLLLYRLSLFLSTKELLDRKFSKSNIEIASFISALKPQDLTQLYDYLTNGVSLIFKLFIEKKRAMHSKESNELSDSVLRMLNTTYPLIPNEIKNELISKEVIENYFRAYTALESVLFVETIAREDILTHWTPSNIHKIPFVTIELREEVLRNIQYPLGQNRLQLINTVFSPQYRFSQFIDETRWKSGGSRDILLLPKMISEKFISYIKEIPVVLGIDEQGRRLTSNFIDQNSLGIQNAFQLLSSGQNISSLHHEFHTLPPIAEPWLSPRMEIPFYILAVGGTAIALGAYTFHSLHRAVGFWGTRSPKEINNDLLEHLSSLRSKPKPDFLTDAEIIEYKKFIEQLTVIEHQKIARKEFRQYVEYVSGMCPLSRTEINEIDTPLTVEISIKPGVNVVKTYEFKDYVLNINNSSKRNKVAQDPVTKEKLTLRNPRVLHIKGFPTFIAPLVTSIREKLPQQNSVTVKISP
ncbi:MAG: hypothetical protein V4501_11795 [Pseudomonadota bacterium]